MIGPDAVFFDEGVGEDDQFSHHGSESDFGFFAVFDQSLIEVSKVGIVASSGEPFHVQQANQIRATREARQAAGHSRTPRVSVSRSIFALVTDADRAYFGGRSGAIESADPVGTIDTKRAIFGRTYAAAPERLVEERRTDEAIAEADTLLLTVPNQLGVDYCAHAIEGVLTELAPAPGWR